MEPLLYQSSHNHERALQSRYVNTKLSDLPTPAAILDAAVVRRNCRLMLETASTLGVQFRAHIKTHKTTQGSKLQVGESGPVRLIVSTIAELEHILPWLKECLAGGREVSVLYGVPAAPSSIQRLAALAQELDAARNGKVAFMVDHPETLELIAKHQDAFPKGSGTPVYIKIDTGYGRAGVKPGSETLAAIRDKLEVSHISDAVSLLGLYSHLGHSYGFSTPKESLDGLLTEFEVIKEVADAIFKGRSLTLSVGATPTASAAQMLVDTTQESQLDEANVLRDRWSALKRMSHNLEIHAGVYPFLDMQQLATQARISNLQPKDISLKNLVEVASVYSERGRPEALVAAGSLALGREPCKSYSGWGVVTPWSSHQDRQNTQHYTPGTGKGWIVGRISQEHGILTWEGDTKDMRKLSIGEKLLVWPNHACVAGAGFGWYYVVDSDLDDGETVHDVWVRCRGW